MSDQKYIPVEGHPGLYRDSSTNAIINMDKSAAKANRAARQKIMQRDKDVETLKQEVKDIKEMLGKLLERL